MFDQNYNFYFPDYQTFPNITLVYKEQVICGKFIEKLSNECYIALLCQTTKQPFEQQLNLYRRSDTQIVTIAENSYKIH